MPVAGRYLAYVREIIIGTNTSVLLCSGTSVSHPRQGPAAGQSEARVGACSQSEASKLHRALTSHHPCCSGDKDKLTAAATLCFILKM